MLDRIDTPPPPPIPKRWAPAFWSMLIVGLVVAFFTVPAFRRDVIFVWDAGRVMVKKPFGF